MNLLYADFVSQESLENSVCNFMSSWFSQFWIELHQGPQPRDTPIGVSGRGDKQKKTDTRVGPLYGIRFETTFPEDDQDSEDSEDEQDVGRRMSVDIVMEASSS